MKLHAGGYVWGAAEGAHGAFMNRRIAVGTLLLQNLSAHCAELPAHWILLVSVGLEEPLPLHLVYLV